jgi:prepilin-type N-terminal cleavage/methylation domain-containing protein
MNDWRSLIGHRTGFSLVETLIVLSIIGIILVIAFPSYTRYAGDQRARAATHLLASDLRVAQQEAITRRVDVTVTFSSEDPACPGKAVASYWFGHAATVIKRVCFPPDVVWTRPFPPLAFTPGGGTGTSATLVVQSARTGAQFALSVTAGTGTVIDATR